MSLRPELAHLTPDERLDLIGELWDSLEGEPLPLTPEQCAELERRIEEMERDPDQGMPMEDLMRGIRTRVVVL